MRTLTLVPLILWLGFVNCCAVSAEDSHPSNKRPRRLMFTDDTQCMREAPATSDQQEFVRQFLLNEVTHFSVGTFCMLAAMPDMCFYDTKVGEVFGDRVPGTRPRAATIRAFREQGTDIIKLATSVMRPRDIELIAKIRMSDTHHKRLAPDDPRSPQFALDHPEFVIRQPDGRQNETALDYSHPEVRAHRLAIMRELAEEYEIDGIELNSIRCAKHFPRNQGYEKAPIMTAFVSEIRQMLDGAARKRNRGRLVLGVRVPEGLRECWLAWTPRPGCRRVGSTIWSSPHLMSVTRKSPFTSLLGSSTEPVATCL